MSLRDSPLGELKVPLTWTAAIALIVAVVAVIAILVSDRRETFRSQAYGATRGVADQVLIPVGDALSAPGRWTGAGIDTVKGYFFAISENQRLKVELKEMRQWRDVALALRNENGRYRTLLGLKTDPPIPMVAARVVLDSRGPFASTRLANAGTEKGIKVGNPVMSETGLVGRIVGVTDGASRVLLTTDTASKIPVMIDRTNARAILTGDGGPNPKLEYLRGQDPVKEGDRVMTSGDGGVMPRGLPVGTAVKGLDGRWRVVLAADKSPIDFVRVLLFEDFTQLVNERQLEEKHVPPPTEGAETVGVVPVAATPAAGAPKPGAAAVTPGAAKPAAAAGPTATTTTTTAKAKPAAGEAMAAKSASTPSAKPKSGTSAAKTPDKTDAKAATTKTTTAKTTTTKTAGIKTTATKPDATKPAAKPKPKPKPPTDDASAEPPH
ncbi:MAG: rod shape-determining protein MreC [Phenylobacterium sp.]|nr:MAG: rod shape-determining protein MreC [Phenylobacterium sp.]